VRDVILGGAARTWWTVHHLRAALAVTMGSVDDGQAGFVNGYVQLPAGHPDLGQGHGDLGVAVHGGSTYGVDQRGWVGFGTGNIDDYWPDDDIDSLIETTPDPRRHSLRLQWPNCRGIKAACRPDTSWPMAWDRDWTVPLLMAEVEDLATQLHTRGLHTPRQRRPLVAPSGSLSGAATHGLDPGVSDPRNPM